TSGRARNRQTRRGTSGESRNTKSEVPSCRCPPRDLSWFPNSVWEPVPGKLRFPGAVAYGKRSFQGGRSQTEFGNEGKTRWFRVRAFTFFAGGYLPGGGGATKKPLPDCREEEACGEARSYLSRPDRGGVSTSIFPGGRPVAVASQGPFPQ